MASLRRLLRHLNPAQLRFHPFEALAFVTGWLWNAGILRRAEYQLRPRSARFPVTLRRGTSDPLVFVQVFVLKEYGAVDDLRDVATVLDCGANVGYSAAYFLSRFPAARLIAVEPDPGNFNLLARNLAPYGERATALCAAVWSHSGRLMPNEQPYRDGREWAHQVRESHAGETGSIAALDLPSLIDQTRATRISLLKMDIEGAEAVVLAAEPERWLGRIDALAIELHDDSQFGPATPVFRRAIGEHRFAVSSRGELTICRRLPEKPPAKALADSP